MNQIWETAYSLAPIWAQHTAISLWGYLWKSERLGGRFSEYVDDFRSRDKWDSEQMEAYLTRLLRQVILRAFYSVPYYREQWANLGLATVDLERMNLQHLAELPVTPKAAVRDRPWDFVDPATPRRFLHRYLTSGSTGTPVTLFCTNDGHRRFVAAREARSFGWANTSIRQPRSMIGGRLVVPKAASCPPFHRYNLAERQIYFSAFHISPKNMPYYVAALNRYRPMVLTGYAYSHFALAQMMLADGCRLDYEPDALILSSEKLTREMKETIQEAFHARAFEEYGAVENCLLATECHEGRLHVSPDFGIVEIVDERGRNVPPGVPGRILCTSLLNEAQPLIRYEIGDLGTWDSEPCPCGRNHLPVLKEIVGRLEDVVVGPDGRRLVRFHGIFVGLPNVIEGQVVQSSLKDFEVRLVGRQGLGLRDEQVIRQRFTERLGDVTVCIEKVGSIPRSERGKFRAVVSHLGKNRWQQTDTPRTH